MKKVTTSYRLRQIMKERSLRQVDILDMVKPYCEEYGVRLGKNDLSQYVNGKVEPRQEKLTVLGLALGVSEAWLMGYDIPMERTRAPRDLPSNMYPLPEMEKIPLVGSIACGTPILAEENIEAYVDLPRHIRADYALECKGDSMIGVDIYDGDIVYIRKQPTVENGQIAAVRIGEEATLKRVYYDGECLQLVAENPKIRPMVFFGEDMNDIVIEGLAVAHCRSLRGI